MGGCKCTFYNCGLTTATSKSMYPDRETHFFHFPIRDRERCIKWAIYSNNMDFLELPNSKIRNKVICDFHFHESNFMNYKRERLTKTAAVPTIYINPESKVEVDLVENPTWWVPINKNKAQNTTYTQSEDINIDSTEEQASSHNNSLINEEQYGFAESEQPALKKVKTETIVPVRILNGNGNLRREVTIQSLAVAKNIPVIKNSSCGMVKLGRERFTIRNAAVSEKTNAVINQQVIEPPIMLEELPTVETQMTPKQETAVVVSSEPSRSEEWKPVMEEQLKQIAEIKELLRKKQSETPSCSTKKSSDESTNISQSQFNKVQLFTGIKRYLSPAMTALLRMELFASPGREYKKDEKIICQELLQLGDKPYSFLHDEWRLRLPAKAEVQLWLDEKASEDDDDAS